MTVLGPLSTLKTYIGLYWLLIFVSMAASHHQDTAHDIEGKPFTREVLEGSKDWRQTTVS